MGLVGLMGLMGLVGCKQDTFRISGTLEGGSGQTLWLEELAPDGPMFIDSIRMDEKGSFEYRYKMPYQSMYTLHKSDNDFIVTLPNYGEQIEVSGNWANLSATYEVEGSEGSSLLWELQQLTNSGSAVLQQLIDTATHYSDLLAAGMVDEATVKVKKEETDSIFRATFADQREQVYLFIEAHPGSLASLIALYKSFNNRPLVDPRTPGAMRYFEMVLEGLQKEAPDNPHTIRYATSVDRMHR